MVYARYGRTTVYQMQELVKMVNKEETDMTKELENTKNILSSLPPSAWINKHRQSEAMYAYNDLTDTEMYDLFLHKRDVSFDISDLYEWVSGAGLHFVDYDRFVERSKLDPVTFMSEMENHWLLNKVKMLKDEKK